MTHLQQASKGLPWWLMAPVFQICMYSTRSLWQTFVRAVQHERPQAAGLLALIAYNASSLQEQYQLLQARFRAREHGHTVFQAH